MPEPATAQRRPSPRPRPADGAARPAAAHLHVVPDTDSEMPTSGTGEAAPTETISAGQSGSPTVSTVETSDSRFRTLLQRGRDYWTMPKGYLQQPPSLADLHEYAKSAPWTAQQAGPVRTFGIWYQHLVAHPYTIKNRLTEHMVQRPLRCAALLGTIKLASMTGPGAWAVDHLVYPVAQFAGHIFL